LRVMAQHILEEGQQMLRIPIAKRDDQGMPVRVLDLTRHSIDREYRVLRKIALC
jgi:hypothetical protein